MPPFSRVPGDCVYGAFGTFELTDANDVGAIAREIGSTAERMRNAVTGLDLNDVQVGWIEVGVLSLPPSANEAAIHRWTWRAQLIHSAEGEVGHGGR